jgi:tetratricopeptide (TPR) repeat protein
MIDLDLQTVTKNLYDKLYTGYYEFSKCKIKEDEDIVDYWKKNLKKEEYTKYKGIESYIIGNISHIQKEYQKAVEYFMLAISIDSQIAYPVNSLGIVYKELKDNDKAIFYYKKAIALDDNYVAPYNNLGVVYNELKDYDKANFYLKKAIALDDKYLTTYINLGIFLIS